MKAFPPDLRYRLCEESHSRALLRTFERQSKWLKPQIESLRNSQTSVDFLLAAAKRPRASTRELVALEAELVSVTESRANLAVIATTLGEEVEQLTEAYVRETDDTYVRGLGAFSDSLQWDAAVNRFANYLTAFITSLGETRAMAAAGYNRATSRVSDKAAQCIDRTVNVALSIEREITYLNGLIDENVDLIRDTPIEAAAPQKLPVVGYSEWAKGLRLMGILDLQKEFERVIAYCEDISRHGVPALRLAFAAARQQVLTLSGEYVLSYVGTLREFSDKHWYLVTEADRAIETLEKRFHRRIGSGHSPDSYAGETSTNPVGQVVIAA